MPAYKIQMQVIRLVQVPFCICFLYIRGNYMCEGHMTPEYSWGSELGPIHGHYPIWTRWDSINGCIQNRISHADPCLTYRHWSHTHTLVSHTDTCLTYRYLSHIQTLVTYRHLPHIQTLVSHTDTCHRQTFASHTDICLISSPDDCITLDVEPLYIWAIQLMRL